MFFKKKEEDPYRWIEKENPWKKAFLAPLPIVAMAVTVVICVLLWHWLNPKIIGEVTQTQMEVLRKTHGKVEFLKKGHELYYNDEIEVEEILGKLSFELDNGARIVADEGTRLKLLDRDKFSVETGRLWIKTPSEMEILFAEGKVLAGESDFELEYSPEYIKISVIKATSPVRFSVNDKQVQVEAGQLSRAYHGKHPLEPLSFGYVSRSWVQFAQLTRFEDVDLSSGSVLTGKLVDRLGLPVEGTVFLISASGGAYADDISDKQGYYMISSVEPGDYVVNVKAPGHRSKLNQPIQFPEKPSKITRDFVLEKGHAIRIHIIDAYGRTLPEPQLIIEGIGGLVRKYNIWSEPDGSLVLSDLAEGEYTLTIVSDGYSGQVIRDVLTDSEKLTITLLPAGKISGSITRAIDSSALKNFSIKVTDFAPAKNAPYFYDGGWKSFESTRGGFVLDNLNPGQYTLLAVHPDLTPVVIADIPVEAGRTTSDIEFLMSEGGSIAGKIMDSTTRQPVVGAAISIYQHDLTELDRLELGPDKSVFSGADGTFDIGAVPAGNVRLIVSHRDYITHRTGFEPIRSGRNTPLEIMMERGGRLSGKILGPDGLPLDEYMVKLLDSGNNGVVTFTDREGNYSFTNLKPDRYSIRVGKSQSPFGRLIDRQKIGLKEIVVKDFQFQPGVKCRGKVVNPEGTPVPAGLTLTSAGVQEHKLIKSTLTNRNGDYVFESLPSGRYEIQITPLFSDVKHTYSLTVPADRELIRDFTVPSEGQSQ